MRNSVFAGQFYEGTKEELKVQLKNCFLSDFGPKTLPDGKQTGNLVEAAIVPHAGYMFSGPCAAHAYNEICKCNYDVFLIIAPNHTGFGRTSILLEDFETPLGVAKVDKEFGKLLIDSCKISDNSSAHLHEHSVEVQIPFLQFIYDNDFKFVPLIISSPANLDSISDGIKKAIEQSEKKVCLIASSDFTHQGENYGYVPFSEDIQENIAKLDQGAIELIQKGDAIKFREYMKQTGATICGYLPIYVLLNTVNSTKVECLKYYTSADIVGDYKNSVSYASIIFR